MLVAGRKGLLGQDAPLIWDRYCSFLDLPLKEFMEIQEQLLLEQIRLVAAAANRQPALAAYWAEERGGPFRGYGVMVFALDGETIVGITGFAGYPQLLPALGLPEELEA